MLPTLSTALASGALLAFALSFDEVIVTTFTSGAQNTLPLWIFGAIRLGQNLPEVNVVVVGVLLLTIVPVVIAARLTGDGGITRGSAQNLRLGTGRPAHEGRPNGGEERDGPGPGSGSSGACVFIGNGSMFIRKRGSQTGSGSRCGVQDASGRAALCG